MKTKFHTLRVLACLLIAVSTSADEASPLESLADAEGTAYVAARNTLLTQPVAEAQEQMQPKLVLLHHLLRARQHAPERFAGFQTIIDQARRGLPFRTQSESRVRRYLSLGTRLAQEAGRDEDVLSLAMAELLWKTGRDDYERRCAARLLCLPNRPTAGVYEMARDVMRKPDTSAPLAQDVLEILAKYVLVHRVGDRTLLVEDIRFVSRQFGDAPSLRALGLKLLRDIDTSSSEALAAEISAVIEQAKFNGSQSPVMHDVPVEVDVK